MAWYTGKPALSLLAWGDSNSIGSGGYTPSGGQETTSGLHCYVSATGQVPYSEANLGWRNGLNPNGTNREPEYNSYISTGQQATAAWVGQILGGNGNPAMQAGSLLKQGTGIDTYVYQASAGGTTAEYWKNGNGWTTLDRTVPAALSGIPGTPTGFDCILFSIGGADALAAVPVETHVTNIKTIRSQMIAEGWWVPGVTQVIILDIPQSIKDSTGGWNGTNLVRARLNDRIGLTSSAGYGMADGVHFSPPYYTNAGSQAGRMFLAQVPKQQSVLKMGGVQVTLEGKPIRVHS